MINGLIYDKNSHTLLHKYLLYFQKALERLLENVIKDLIKYRKN